MEWCMWLFIILLIINTILQLVLNIIQFIIKKKKRKEKKETERYEWSKNIVRKIYEANCLSKKELIFVEMALRVEEITLDILDEASGVSEENNYELKFKLEGRK